MSRATWKGALKHLVETFDLVAQPRELHEVLSDACLELGWSTSEDEAAEMVAPWIGRVDSGLRVHLFEFERDGRVVRFAFNTVSPYLIQGAAYAEKSDSDSVKVMKAGRAQSAKVGEFLRSLTPVEFEALCRGVLEIFGCSDPSLTASSKDQGIDFYGQLSLAGKLQNASALPSVDQRFRVWIVGQAKHYVATKVATPDLRELAGSVELAKTRTFADFGRGLEKLQIAALDPVFYLFITTGQISSDAWTLLRRSGMLALDGSMLEQFLAENHVGYDGAEFSHVGIRDWLERQLA